MCTLSRRAPFEPIQTHIIIYYCVRRRSFGNIISLLFITALVFSELRRWRLDKNPLRDTGRIQTCSYVYKQ